MAGLIDAFFGKPKQIKSKETYNYLVVAALQEELNEFYNLQTCFKKHVPKDGGALEVTYNNSKAKNEIKILTYTSNKMGMPYNAAAIMRIISMHQPVFTFFIGTCAGLFPDKQKAGDVLVPHLIFSYESGKHNEHGNFEGDYISFETSEDIRKYAEIIKNRVKKDYDVTTDENFCSGAAVIDNKEKKEQIKNDSARKVTGLDMEAFSIACINNILKEEKKKLIVIKGIMDFGEDKGQSEKKMNKMKAKKNSAKFAFEVIKYIDENILGTKQNVILK